VSELASLTWGQVLPRETGEAQLAIVGKGDKPRNVLLPPEIAAALAAMREGAAAEARVFPISERRINYIVKAAAKRAGINPAASVSSPKLLAFRAYVSLRRATAHAWQGKPRSVLRSRKLRITQSRILTGLRVPEGTSPARLVPFFLYRAFKSLLLLRGDRNPHASIRFGGHFNLFHFH
jgi:hypothetical protein